MHKTIAIAALLAILILVNWSISTKERQLRAGRIVYLELAPVDPRSLMQGDYMALRFHLANEVEAALPKTKEGRSRNHVAAADGYAVVSLDAQGRGSFLRLDAGQTLAEDEVRMRYRVRNGAIKFATNAYFFQEGHGRLYQPARYGQFRVDDCGELLLTALYDEGLKRLGPPGGDEPYHN